MLNLQDLFSSYYQIRTGVKFAPRIQSATKVEVKSEVPLPFGGMKILKTKRNFMWNLFYLQMI